MPAAPPACLRKSLRVVMSVSSLGKSLRNGSACRRAARLSCD
jgi:hypothetical protein